MSRRKLSQNQQRRIRAAQRRREETASGPGSIDTNTAPDADLGGILVARFGKQAEVVDALGRSFRCHLRANIGNPVTGDRVIWQRDGETGIVTSLLERRSVLERPDAAGRLRPVAANLDQIILVIAPEPIPHTQLVDRYLVAAEHANVHPVLLLNKVDQLALPGSFDSFLEPYRRAGYTVLSTSTQDGFGLASLRTALANRTSAFVGQSGVGKSALIAALMPDEEIRVGGLSEGVGKGQHTTTTSRLYRFGPETWLIDSPGVREFGLDQLSGARLAWGFPEFRPFLGRCRYSDCAHVNEPGCSLRDAVDTGIVHASRYASYRDILRSCAPATGMRARREMTDN